MYCTLRGSHTCGDHRSDHDVTIFTNSPKKEDISDYNGMVILKMILTLVRKVVIPCTKGLLLTT